MIHTNASSVSDCHCQVYLPCYALQLGSATSPPSCEILVNCGLYIQVTRNPILSLAGLVILVLLVLELVISISMYMCRRRQPMPKKSEKDLKEHIRDSSKCNRGWLYIGLQHTRKNICVRIFPELSVKYTAID